MRRRGGCFFIAPRWGGGRHGVGGEVKEPNPKENIHMGPIEENHSPFYSCLFWHINPSFQELCDGKWSGGSHLLLWKLRVAEAFDKHADCKLEYHIWSHSCA
jgi:hypothetical protein